MTGRRAGAVVLLMCTIFEFSEISGYLIIPDLRHFDISQKQIRQLFQEHELQTICSSYNKIHDNIEVKKRARPNYSINLAMRNLSRQLYNRQRQEYIDEMNRQMHRAGKRQQSWSSKEVRPPGSLNSLATTKRTLPNISVSLPMDTISRRFNIDQKKSAAKWLSEWMEQHG